MTSLYYEAHVTIDPLFGEQLDMVERVAVTHSFRVAKLLMQKRPEDTPERSRYDTFLTGTGKDFEEISVRTKGIVRVLQLLGHTVRRYKIEDTLVDSKHGDTYALLPPPPQAPAA